MEYTIILNEQDMQILNMAIGEIPFKVAAPFVERINAQLKKQSIPTAPATLPEFEKKEAEINPHEKCK